jgi:hypothetical protein
MFKRVYLMRTGNKGVKGFFRKDIRECVVMESVNQ